MSASELLIVVPARGGSRGLARKNAVALGGVPLLEWTANAIRSSGLEGYAAVLSTDDEDIASIGRSAGLEVPFLRPADLASDEATAEDVALHACDWYAAHRGFAPRFVMLLQPTSPLRPPGALKAAIDMLSADATLGAVVAVKAIYRSLRTLFYAETDMTLAPVDERDETPNRRQAVRPLYTPNGALYATTVTQLQSSSSFFPPRCRAIVMDQIASLDIDDATDLAIADAIVTAGLAWRR